MTTEIEDYIAEQKAKVAKERQEAYQKAVTNVDNNKVPEQSKPRKQWDRDASHIKPVMSRRPETPDDGATLRIGNSMEEKRRKLQQERQREYNQMLAQKGGRPQQNTKKAGAPSPAGSRDGTLPIGKYEQDRKKFDVERKQEYNDLMSKTGGGKSGRKPQPSPGRRDLNRQTKRKPEPEFESDDEEIYFEENQPPQQNGYKENVPPRTQATRAAPPRLTREETPEEGLIGRLGGYEQKKKKLNEERRQEYNQLLTKQGARTPKAAAEDAARPDSQREDDTQRRELSDDDEEDIIYARYLRERAPRRGWATPTYEEVLDKKRRDERAYRRYDDLGLRASRSDGNLNRQLQDDLRKLKDLDREYESKKVRFSDTERGKRILDDPEWLRRDQRKITDLYEDSDLYSEPDNRDDGRLDRVDRDLSRPRQGGTQQPTNRRGAPSNEGPQGTFNIGGNVRASADQRKKAAYRKDLEKQMQQTQSNKQREKKEDLRVNVTGAVDPFGNPARTNLPPPAAPRREQPSRLLDDNFRSVLAAGGQGPLETYTTPLDDAYYYYGKVNPLDPASLAPGQGGVSLQDQLGPTQDTTPRVTFADSRQDGAQRGRIPKATSGTGEVLAFPSDDDRSRSRQETKKSYQKELQRQMEEDKKRKEAAKQEKDRYDRKLEEDIKNYDPFGKGGGGAPMRDYDGTVRADLRKMKQDNDETLLSGRQSKNYRDRSLEAPLSFRQDEYGAPSAATPALTGNPEDAAGYARGGNGIFGEPMSNEQKKTRTKYQDELSQQIEEKKRQKELEKQQIKLEEEKLLKKIEEDQRKAKEDFESEKRKEREKADAAQKAAEEVVRQQQEKKLEQDRKRREEDDRRQAELRDREEQRRREAQDQRSSSPPIPTLRDKQASKPQSRGGTRGRSPPVPALRSKTEPDSRAGRNTDREKSPPIPAQRTQSRQSRVQSADVLNQLARMKQQLKNESKRVEADLRNEQEEPEVYDPRLQRRADPQTSVDIFDVAGERERMRKPSRESADPSNIHEFKKLKKGNTTSRQKLHKMFPETPTNSDALETQQRVLLDAQENDRRGGGGKSPFDRRMPDMTPKGLGLLREGSVVSANLLDSDSAFIDVPSGIPNFDDSRRNDTARSRRRQRPMETPNSYRAPSSRSVYDPSMGSQVSLNPDAINRKNEDRLRKLKTLTGDEVSMGDPDDILDRFMAKQQHYRPPSGHTLQDDSWLRPGTHVDR